MKVCLFIGILLQITLPPWPFDTDSLEKQISNLPPGDKIEYYLELADFFSQKSFEKSFFYANNAITLARSSGLYEKEVDALHVIAICHAGRSRFDKALKYFQQALAISLEKGYKMGIAKSYNGIGVAYKNTGDLSKALENYMNALRMFEDMDEKPAISTALSNIGNIYCRWKKYDSALEYFNRSLQIAEEINDYGGQSRTLTNMGLLFCETEQYEDAIKNFKKTLDYAITNDDMAGMARAYQNIGDVYAFWKNYEMAVDYYLKSLEIEKQIGNNLGIIISLYSIGKMNSEFGYAGEALIYYNDALELAMETNALNEMKDICQDMAMIYDSLGNTDKSYEYYRKYVVYKDSIFNIVSQEKFAELETIYETEKKEKEISILEKDKELNLEKIARQRLLIIVFITGLVIIIVFAFVLFYLFRQRTRANRLLREQKEEILSQRDEIEAQRDLATEQRDLIASQKREITDSILYARHIQKAVFPPAEAIRELLPQHFVFFKPRDIVSGDFFWLAKKEGKIFIAVADCTGHGVPGAFMSMLGITFLNELINRSKNLNAGQMLDSLRDMIINSLHQAGSNTETSDGMDVSLCIIDPLYQKINYSGANNPLYIVGPDGFEEINADKMPVGLYYGAKESFKNHIFDYRNNTMIYMFTDGFPDQFGGEYGRKYKYQPFKKLLTGICDFPYAEQMEILEKEFTDWKGGYDQVDDILIIGIRL